MSTFSCNRIYRCLQMTTRPTQAIFNEGLVLAFNFNQGEAQARFNATITAEPDSCPMCWWGVAYSHGPFLNHPYGRHPDDASIGLAAARRAASHSSTLPVKERGLIESMVTRFPTTPGNWTAAAARTPRPP